MTAQRESRRPWWLPLFGVVVYLAVAIGALHVAGVAGYRLGWLWSLAVVAGATGLLAWRWLGPAFPGRGTWIAAFVIVGVAASGWLVDHAPLSKARLRGEIDAIHLQFVRKLSETSAGHSWCRPTCPEVERVYRAPATTTFKAIFDTAALMRVHGQLTDIEPIARRHPQHFLRVFGQRTITEIRSDKASDHVRLRISVTARRGRVRHPAPIQSDSWTNSRIR
ncbi:MAG: hypothetical protein H0W70_14590 [Actinobacteria bacterium]|nr:hypothetical protein [Actinomycetota bacterium]